MPAASADQQLAALLHDAPEYVIGDMISPFKAVMGGGYKVVEERLQEAIHLRFGLPARMARTLKAAIKRADIVSAYFEATELAGFSEREAVKYFGRPRGFFAAQFDLDPKPAHVVQREFIARFEAIETSRKAER